MTTQTLYKQTAPKLRVEDLIADRSTLLADDLMSLSKEHLVEITLSLYKLVRRGY